MRIIIIILCFLHRILCHKAWIDPHSMDLIVDRNKPSSSSSSSITNNNEIILISEEKQCNCDMHMRRIINLMLANAHFEEFSTGYLIGSVSLRLNKVDYDFLKTATGGPSMLMNDFIKISSIFEQAVEKNAGEKFMEMTLSMQERIYLMVFNPYSGSLAGAILFLFIIYKLLQAHFSWKSIFKYLCCITFVFDFVINYLQIVREEEIENMVKIKEFGSVMPECNPNLMSWGIFLKTKFLSTFSHHPCKEYYEATHNNNFWIVPPIKVLSRQIKDLIVQPLEYIGEGFGKFSSSVFRSLPLGYGLVMFPILMVLSVLILFVIFIFISSKKFKISLPFISLEIGPSLTTTITDSTNNANIQKQIKSKIELHNNIQPRKMVEEVKSPKKCKMIKKKKSRVLDEIADQPSASDVKSITAGTDDQKSPLLSLSPQY